MSFQLSSSPLYADNGGRRESQGLDTGNGEKGRSPETRSLQAVIFDYGTVLSYAPTSQQWEELASTAGRVRELAEFQTDYWRYRDEYDRAACGAAAYWQAVARRPLEPKTLGKLIELDNEQWTRVNPEMLALGAPLAQGGREDGNSVEHGVRDARRHGGEVRLAERIRGEDFFLQGADGEAGGGNFSAHCRGTRRRARLRSVCRR